MTALAYSLPSAQEALQPRSPLISSFEKHQTLKNSSPFRLEWIQLGPTLNGSRVEAVQAHPDRPGMIFVAFGSGGLWKSTNNGLSWKCIFENQPSLGIGDIALAPSDPEIIYLGTGESLKKARNFTMPGVGIYRSADGGDSWHHLGLDDVWHIGEISVHPQNPDLLLVAGMGHFWSANPHRGIYRSEDGGQTWEHVLFVDDQTAANDVVFSPADPSVAYATMWENYPGVHGSNSGVYKSIDTGKTWSKVTDGITIDANTGRMGVAASYQNADKAYVFVDQRNRGPDDGAGEVYVTNDGGEDWTRTHHEDIMSLSVIGWYFMDIYVNPQDDDEIFCLGVRLLHSSDGGASFNMIGGDIKHLVPSPAQTLHLDHCEMWINPSNPIELWLGNDGGLYHSLDRGKSWLHLNNLPTGEFYDIELDFHDPYTIYGGTQDDATVYGPGLEWDQRYNDKWKYLWIDAWSGGDGCITLVDPDDKNTVYFSMQNGNARRLDLISDTSVSIAPKFKTDSLSLQYNFITPYLLSPHNSDRIYMAGNYVLKSENRGDDWDIISPDLIKLRSHELTEIAAGALAESSLEEGLIYVGTDRGTVWRSVDEGEHWANVSGDLPPHYIRCIHPSIHQKERVYLQMSGLNYDDFGAYLYVSDTYGDDWRSITGNLPDQPVNFVTEHPDFEHVLLAGTYRGVYLTTDQGQNWSYLGSGLPDASIADLVIEARSGDLIAATHGRGIYKVNLQPLDRYLNDELDSDFLCKIPTAKAPSLRDTHKDVEQQSVEKVAISYWLERDGQVEMSVSTQADSLLWHQEFAGRTGLNQFRWDLVLKEQNSPLPYFIHYKKYLPRGEYKFKLSTKRGEYTEVLIVD